MNRSEVSQREVPLIDTAGSSIPAVRTGRIMHSRDGYAVNTDDETWQLNKHVSINVGRARNLLLPRLREGFTDTLAFFAKERQARTPQNYVWYAIQFLETTQSRDFSEEAILNYRAGLEKTTEHNHLTTVRCFLKRWQRLRPGELDAQAMHTLTSLKLKNNIQGDRVKRLDPLQGPLTDNELAAFNEGAVIAFENEAIDLGELTFCLLSSHGGRRPIQLSHCKVGDLQEKDRKGQAVRLVHIPRAKQQAGSFRGAFTAFATSEELWAVVSAQAERAVMQAEAIFGVPLQETDRYNVPLVPNLPAMREQAKQGLEMQTLQALLVTDVFHMRAGHVTKVLQRAVTAADVRSERTGKLLHIEAYRFRYTVGTRAAREGFGALVIAALLDHSGAHCARIYTANVPEFADKIDAAVGHQLLRYAKAFQGTVVKREADAELGYDPASRLRFQGEDIATCGQMGKCGANVPVPCYTCPRFQPWADAPHHKILQKLLAERQEVLDETQDREVASANDRTILAVMQVIEKCADLKKTKARKGSTE
jgi:hypothetical protein